MSAQTLARLQTLRKSLLALSLVALALLVAVVLALAFAPRALGDEAPSLSRATAPPSEDLVYTFQVEGRVSEIVKAQAGTISYDFVTIEGVRVFLNKRGGGVLLVGDCATVSGVAVAIGGELYRRAEPADVEKVACSCS